MMASRAAARVLLADDSSSARQVLSAMMRGFGWDVDEVRDGLEALRTVALAAESGGAFEAVLLDWKMPSMDGVECARKIVSTLGQRAPGLVLVSAFDPDAARLRFERAAGKPIAVLRKPVTSSSLFETVARVIGRKLDQVRQPSTAAGLLEEQRRQLRGARILLVEDSPIEQELVWTLLGDARMAVTIADDGSKALDALATGFFDAVLMNGRMPVMDGYAATREIRRNPKWRSLPIIALTADVTTADRERALLAGMNDHLGKPIVEEAFFACLALWVRPRAAHRASARPVAGSRDAALCLESVAGIDLQAGRINTMGNDGLYARLLLQFRESLRAFDARNASAAELRDLRSVAGTLGVRGVHEAAAALDHAGQSDKDHAQEQRLRNALMQQIDIVLKGLDGLDRLDSACR